MEMFERAEHLFIHLSYIYINLSFLLSSGQVVPVLLGVCNIIIRTLFCGKKFIEVKSEVLIVATSTTAPTYWSEVEARSTSIKKNYCARLQVILK